MAPFVSIIIPTCRSDAAVIELIGAGLAGQTFKDFEVIVVDEHVGVVGRHDALVSLMPGVPVTHVRPRQHRDGTYKPSMFRNTGLFYARGELLMFLDDFTEYTSDLIQRHVDAYLSSGKRTTVIGVRHIRNVAGEVTSDYRSLDESGTPPHVYEWCFTCNVSVPRSVAIDINGFDEEYDGTKGYSDIDFGMRASFVGHMFVIDKTCGVVERRTGNEMSNIRLMRPVADNVARFNLVRSSLERGDRSLARAGNGLAKPVASASYANVNARSPEMPVVGILTVWACQGLGYHGAMLARVIESMGYRTHILSYTFNENRSATMDPVGLAHESVTYTGHGREDMPSWKVVNWIREKNISTLIIAEPVQAGTGALIRYVKQRTACKVILAPMIEIVRKEELNRYYGEADAVLCHNRIAYDVMSKVIHEKAIYVGWFSERLALSDVPDAERAFSPPLRFFHAAGWGGDMDRKDTERVILTFDGACPSVHDGSSPVAQLVLTTQRPLHRYSRKVQDAIRGNPSIVVRDGNMPREEMHRLVATCHVAVYPSLWEGLGLPFYEALSYGMPVITTDAAPMNEIVSHGLTGYICDSDPVDVSTNPDPVVRGARARFESLERGFMWFVEHTSNLDAMRKLARDVSRIEYSVEQFRLRMFDVLHKRRVMFIAQYYYPTGGAEKSTHLMLSSMTDVLDCTAVSFCRRTGDVTLAYDVEEVSTLDGVTTVYGVAGASVRDAIRQYIERYAPDIVMTQLRMADDVIAVCSDMHVPTVFFVRSIGEHFCNQFVTRHCPMDEDMSCIGSCPYSIPVETRSYPFTHATFVATASRYMAGLVERVYDRRSVVIPPAIARPSSRTRHRREYVLMIKGNTEKGLDTVRNITKMMPDVRFVNVGGSGSDSTSRVESMPYNSDISDVYSRAMCVLVPSIGLEGFGRVAVEAMSYGVPVIASKRGGLRESAAPAVLIDDYLDEHEWVRAIRMVMDDASFRAKLIVDGYEHARMFYIDDMRYSDTFFAMLSANDKKIAEVLL